MVTSLFSQRGASTALMMAAKRGNCEMIDILLRHGADINAKNQVIPFERCADVRLWWARVAKRMLFGDYQNYWIKLSTTQVILRGIVVSSVYK